MAELGHHDRFDWVVVDLGGVMARWLPDRRLVALSQLCGLPPATIDQLVFESGFDDAGERGAFPDDAFADELRRLLGLDDRAATAAVPAAWAQAFEPDRRMAALVVRLSVPAALFTNNGPLLEQAVDDGLLDLGPGFRRRLFSWRLGVTKPDPTAFARATEWLEVDPARVFFVDDSEANVAAARDAGWTAHRHTHALDLTAVLTDLDLLLPA